MSLCVRVFLYLTFLVGLFFHTTTIQAKVKKEKPITIAVTGDVMLGRKVNQILTKTQDYSLPYRLTRNLLISPDITVINLESPLIDNCPVTEVGMVFCGNSKSAQALADAGVDVASLANNHALNYGKVGLQNTIDALKQAGIVPFGVTDTATIKRKGKSFAFLGFNDVGPSTTLIKSADPMLIKNDIQNAKKTHDYTIVLFHWGSEYTSRPSKRQQTLARLAIDSGADLVVGNHPHWVQDVEKYENKIIAYSHGNFIFDQMWSQETRRGVVGLYTFYPSKQTRAKFVPIVIDDFYLPRLATETERKIILPRTIINPSNQ